MKFEFDTDKMVENIAENVLAKEIEGKTIKQLIEIISKRMWISVKDELPKKKGDYLIYNTDGLVWIYWYNDGWYDSDCCISDNVTHWMPLPEPPEEEKTE